MMQTGPAMHDDEPTVEMQMDGILDLHTFQPQEIDDLVPDYLRMCQERGVLLVRVVHGKGTGTLRETVHGILKRMPEVESFRLAGPSEGEWGATMVVLNPANRPSEE
jgi:DNA-nicking Smr family endonuclease